MPRRLVLWSIALLGALGMLVAGLIGSSQAADPWSVQVIGTTGPDDVAIDAMTYGDAVAALQADSAAGGPTVLPVAPSGFPGITTANATLDQDDTNHTLTVGGPVDLLGANAQMLVTAVWADAGTDTAPSVTVAFRTDDAKLSDLAPSLDAVDVGLTKAWTAFRRDAADTSAIPVGDLPQAGQDFFDDGVDATDDDLVVGQGVAFRGLVDGESAGLGDALGRIGVASARLDGTLSTSDDALEDGDTTGFALEATLSVNSPDTMPDWLELGETWVLSLTKSGSDLSVGVAGDATVTLGDTPVTASASVSVTSSAGALSMDLSIAIDEVVAPFGAEWMTLDAATLDASISADGVAGTLATQITVGEAPDSITGTVEVTLEKSADGLSASLDAALSGTISTRKLAELVGADTTTLPDDVDVSLTDPAFYVAVDGTTTPKGITVSFTGTADVTLGGTSLGATILGRYGPDGLLVAARPSGPLTLSDLVGDVAPDPSLPDLSVVVSTQEVSSPSGDLDAPTYQYFQPVLCPDGTDCEFDLELARGVTLAAAIQLPADLTDPLAEIGLEISDPLRVTGEIPAFGGTTTSLTVELPGLSSAGDGGYVRGAGLDLEIRKAGGTISFGLNGSLTLGIPRVESDDCPSGITVDGTCIDEVSFMLTGRFLFETDSATFRIEGGLESAAEEGWQQPFGIPYLTLHEAKLTLGVTTGAGAGVQIGFLGRLVVGQTDISISALVGVTPNTPYLDFKGFTGSSQNGLSMRQLAKLFEEVSGEPVPTAVTDVLPPVGVRNLFLSIGHVDDPDLCLRSGFYLSADLYLDKGTPNGSLVPGCLPPPDDGTPSTTDQCEADSDCLASVLIDVQTGKGGGIPSINAEGYVAGWNAGPLTFDPTFVQLTLKATGARVFIQGGAELKDPVIYISDPSTTSTWAKGTLTLDVGTQRLLVKGDLSIADDFIEAGFEGSGKLDLTDPDFAFSMYLRAAFLDDIAEGIDEAIKAVDAALDEFSAAFSTQNVDKVFGELRGAFTELGSPTSTTWNTISTGYFDFRDDIDSANSTLSSFGLPTIPLNEVMDMALHGIVIPDIPGVTACIFGECFTVWPSIPIPDIPGMCSYVPVLKDTLICTATKDKVDDALRSEYAAPVIRTEVVDAGLAVPAGVSVESMVTKFSRIEPTSTPATASARRAATGGTEITCAVAPVSYPNGSVGNTTFDVQTMGTTVTVTGAEPDDLAASGGAATTAAVDEAEQDTFKALLTTSDTGGCTGSAPPPGPTKVLTMNLAASFVEEGSSLSASGTSVGGAAGETVTLRWGDGTTSTTTLSATKTWQATHVYADDVGAGRTTTYTVRAEAPEHTGAIRQIGVTNVAPSLADMELDPASVDEAEVATLSGRVVDPGTLDTHTVVVDWGDGTAPETVPVVARAFTATHVFADDNPTSTDRDSVPVSIDVTDKDRAAVEEIEQQEILNTRTFGVTAGAPNQLVDRGTTFARTGKVVTWHGTASDRSAVDTLIADVDWADGTSTGVIVAPNGTANRPWTAQHGWTEPCVYSVTVDVSDDDQGAAGTIRRTVVVTRATADKMGGIRWWTDQFRRLDAGRRAALTPAQAGCYLSVARHLSTTLGLKLRLRTSPQAYDVLSMTRPSGLTRPTPAQAELAQERDRLDRALLGALLDFTYGRRAWDTPVAREHRRLITFAQLVDRADKARTSRSVERIRDVRKLLTSL